MCILKRTEFEGRRIAVVGIARTGLAAAPVLRDLGASVLLSDMASDETLGERAAEARELGVDVRTRATPEDSLAGADLVVPAPGIPADSPLLRLAVRLGIPVLSEIEVAYRIARAPILAVTGTNGKTTTTMWLGAMLEADGRRAWVAGNVAADEVKQPLVTAAYRAEPGDAIVAEISSFQLEWVERFRPKIGVLTNITPDHQNRHRTMAEYVACKARLFAAQGPDDWAVVNAVNAHARKIGASVASRLVWFDRGNCLSDDSACVRDGWLTVCHRGEEHRLCRTEELRLPGAHNVENGLAAAAAAIVFGARPEAVARALREFGPVAHRMEPVAVVDGVRYINNSMCTNVDAAIRSIEAVDGPVVVIAGGSSKDADFTPLGSVLARRAKRTVLIGQAADQIEAAARAVGYTEIDRAESLEAAVDLARRAARPGDTVMLSPACASFGMFRDFEERGAAFRSIVQGLRR